jgi:hypothetical protein
MEKAEPGIQRKMYTEIQVDYGTIIKLCLGNNEDCYRPQWASHFGNTVQRGQKTELPVTVL